MPDQLKRFVYSRKMWAFLVGLVTLISASIQDGSFSAEEIEKLVYLVVGYVLSVALEDGLSNINPPKPVQTERKDA